jgi:hypothetical protein
LSACKITTTIHASLKFQILLFLEPAILLRSG